MASDNRPKQRKYKAYFSIILWLIFALYLVDMIIRARSNEHISNLRIIIAVIYSLLASYLTIDWARTR